MTEPARRPFQGMTREKWVNLAVAAILVFYAIQIALDFAWGTMCGHIGPDYCDYWSAGRIANQLGYARIYDLQLIGEIEKSIFPPSADPSLFVTTPFPYLPVFVLPFQALTLLPPTPGFGIWTLLNLGLLVLYLRFFSKSLKGPAPQTRLFVMICASLPVFFNVFYGQVAALLTVCVGEFMRAVIAGKPFRAGLWLGGLLLKPQVLLLLGLILLIQRATRILAGLAATSIPIIAASILLMGRDGLARMISVWLGYAAGQESNGVESMMNWRMLGVNLAPFTATWIAWALVAIGMLATLIVVLHSWRRPFQPGSASFPVGLLGILSASTVLAWHSHVHTALLLVPPILALRQQNALPQKAIDAWVLGPALLFIAVLLPEHLLRLNLLPSDAMHLVYFMRGGGEFAASLCLLGWAVRRSPRQERTE